MRKAWPVRYIIVITHPMQEYNKEIRDEAEHLAEPCKPWYMRNKPAK